ncbi:hypothetical protein DH2020_042766 [Rehmannia glutinosa]|uniref:Uncharacterized protein n=1 Tax=Rehmannia glutinosa TaxID=99300 RepID=A0ABR0UMB6_REHGL
MGNTEKLMQQIMDLKFTSKSLQRQARKCEKEEKTEKLKVKKAIEKGNMDGARIYAENSIRKRNEQMNYLRLSSRLDAVVARLDTQAKMTAISKSMGNIVKSLESSLATGNLQKMSETMDSFERQFVNMEVQAEFMESSMAGSTLSPLLKARSTASCSKWRMITGSRCLSAYPSLRLMRCR